MIWRKTQTTFQNFDIIFDRNINYWLFFVKHLASLIHAGVVINVLEIDLQTTGSFSCGTLIYFETELLGGHKNIEQ